VPAQPLPLLGRLQRSALLLKLPVGAEALLERLPATTHDRSGRPCLLVLPSDSPSPRSEAQALEAALAALLSAPGTAALRALHWRAETLRQRCAGALETLVAHTPDQRWLLAPAFLSAAQLNPRPELAAEPFVVLQNLPPASTAMRRERSLQSRGGDRAALQSRGGDRAALQSRGGDRAALQSRGGGDRDRSLASFGGAAASARPFSTSRGGAGPPPSPGRRRNSAPDEGRTSPRPPPSLAEVAAAAGPQGLVELSVAVAVCYADVVRQVEVACGERGRTLARLWNAQLALTETTMEELRRQVADRDGQVAEWRGKAEELDRQTNAVRAGRRRSCARAPSLTRNQ
jgi:hypothetical protein